MTATANGWMASRPPEAVLAGPVHLRRVLAGDSAELAAAVNESLGQLAPWMPWASQAATPESQSAFLSQAAEGWEMGREFDYLMRLPGPVGRRGARAADRVDQGSRGPEVSGPVVGSCGLHARVGPGALEIGYWVRTSHHRRGIATAAAGKLTAVALSLPEVSRVEIHCDAANIASAGVAAKLGYRLDRVDPVPPAAPGESGRKMIWVLATR